MKWITIPEHYLNFLRKTEPRIPHSDYGRNHFKPFFGALFETNSLLYVTQVSSPKTRHNTMKQNLDFYKLYDKSDKKLLAVVNLNYMFPEDRISKRCIDFIVLEELAFMYQQLLSSEEQIEQNKIKNAYASLDSIKEKYFVTSTISQ